MAKIAVIPSHILSEDKMLKIGIFGLTGRMGRAIIDHVLSSKDAVIMGGTSHEQQGNIHHHGQDYHFKIFTDIDDLVELCDVMIDFSTASILSRHLEACVRHKKPIVIGTTGFDANTQNKIQESSGHIAVLQSGNMSLGVNILSVLVQKTASILGNDWDIEITEGHHRNKIDAPSGTALLLGESAAAGRGQSLKEIQRLERTGHTGIRPAGEIGFSVIRAGSIIGDHSVLFAHENEHITLSHHARNRNIFASGAVFAAKKIVSMPTGFYKMTDVLDLGL